MTEDLRSKLSSLASLIVKETTSHIDSGEVKEVERDYLRPEFYDFECQPYGIKCSVELIPQERTEWNPFDLSLFIRDVVRELQEYKEVQEIIEKKYPEGRRGFRALANLMENVVSKTYEKKINAALNEYISVCVNDVNNNPITWNCKSWLTGIWLEEESNEISQHVSIRRPEPRDLEEEWIITVDTMKSFGSEGGFDPRNFTILNPGNEYGHLKTPLKGGGVSHCIIPKLSAIMEFVCQTQDPTSPHSYQVFSEVARVLDCLVLFGTGAAFSIKTAAHPISFIERPTYYIDGAQVTQPDSVYSGSFRYRSDYYQYQLNTTDVPKLAAFIKEMRRLYPGEGITESIKPGSPIHIAFSRYQSALLESHGSGIAGQITFAMMVLEALLLKDTEKNRLSKKLRKRTCTLMKFFGWHPITVYNDVRESYTIRSDYVHGSVNILTADPDAVERSKRALAYARNTLFLFIYLRILDNMAKQMFIDDIIDEIHQSSLQQAGQSKLSAKIPLQRWLCHPR
jgi:hypothetical protein